MIDRWVRPTRLTWWAAAFAAGTWLTTAGLLAAAYSRLPFGLPVRYVRGTPLIYQVKTPAMVLLPAIVQGALLLIFGAIVLLLLFRARPKGGDESSPPDTERMRLAAEGIAVLAAIWIGVQAIGAARLINLWLRGGGGFGDVYSVVMITAIVLSVVSAARTMKLVGRERRVAAPADPSLWRLRSLYVNPRDPSLFVPTRTGMGFTLNFGRPVAIVILFVTIVAGVGAPYLLARFVLVGFGS